MYKILTFDGGGARGLFYPFFFKHFQHPLHYKIQMFAGTSTGAIFAAALAVGLDNDITCDLYEKLSKSIFKNKKYPLFTKGGTFYDSAVLRKSLVGSQLGGYTMKDCKTRLLVTAVSVSSNDLVVFDSSVTAHENLKLVDVLMSSTAAPSYFPPHHIEQLDSTYIDGGLSCNNPSIQAIRYAIDSGHKINEISLLSFGCGSTIKSNASNRYDALRLVGWRQEVIEIMMKTASDNAHFLAENILEKSNYFRVNPVLGEEIKLDQAKKSLEILPTNAHKLANDPEVIMKIKQVLLN